MGLDILHRRRDRSDGVEAAARGQAGRRARRARQRWPTGGSTSGSSTGDIYCRDAKTGDEAWTYRAAGGEKGVVHSSVLVADGLVIALDGTLFALDAKTGSSAWKQPKVGGRENSPVLCRCGERTLAPCTVGEKLVEVDAKTGELLPYSAPGGS